MALSATTIARVISGGSDTTNGGLFDPGQTAGCNTDGAATVANTASPVFTSASYNFVSGDIGAWLYIASGTNWLAGWYQIASVASNAATLSAAAGAATLSNYGLSTATGCATVASPTAATWTIDYSLQTAAQFAYTDLTAAGAGLVLSSAGHPFGKQQVGNSIVLTGGTNVTTERIVLASVSGVNGTFVGPANATSGATSNGAGGMGGALASPGQAGAVMVAGNDLTIASGTYTVTSASSNVAAGCLTLPASASNGNVTKMIGYGSVVGDQGTAPIIKASGISTFTLITLGTSSHIENITVDCNSLTAGTGMAGSNTFSRAYRCTVKNATVLGFNAIPLAELCYATGNSGASFSNCLVCDTCTASGNTATPFTSVSGSVWLNCTSVNNTGASTDGFLPSANTVKFCTASGNGRHGFNVTVSTRQCTLSSCYSEGNSGYGFTASAATDILFLYDCGGYNNTSGNVNTSVITSPLVGFITLTSTAFNNAAGLDFSLNNAATGGALLQGQGIPGHTSALQLQGLSTLSYPDIGAATRPLRTTSPLISSIIQRV